ncbi:EpsI family protein [Altererythrobacter aurantiacus]|uniref:EpsI family protein n=1 Tax=Parapontixanthobacter aurantiacus TaxID=1463599 RepID=A0A844ZGR6_9SPHN|nr:exosortase-associated protein EpsI, V-type [Parapontixanthobacter aurantiacus]MXO87045.1 EpsI family protein [Parapontixanthobacter aurantiacus]
MAEKDFANPGAPTRATQPLISRRHMLIGGALAAASGIAYARMPTPHKEPVDPEEFEEMVPRTVGGYEVVSESGVVLPPPDTLRDRLYDNLATRVYSKEQATPIMLLLAYNNTQDGVLQVHRPEVCYPVGGFELTPTQELPIAAAGRTIPSNFFTATGPDRVEQVAYFTRLGSAYPRSWAEQRLSVVRANLAGNIPDGMLMRVSMLSPNRENALEQLRDFAANFIAASPPALQRLLLA